MHSANLLMPMIRSAPAMSSPLGHSVPRLHPVKVAPPPTVGAFDHAALILVLSVLAIFAAIGIWFPEFTKGFVYPRVERALRAGKSLATRPVATRDERAVAVGHAARAIVRGVTAGVAAHARLVALGFVAAFVDLLLLADFNTLRWPYLWVQPGVFIVVGFVAVCLWYPEMFRGVASLRTLGLAMIFIGECYLVHSAQVALRDPSPLDVLHFVGVAGTFAVMALSYVNQVAPRKNTQAPPLPADLPHVAAVVPTYDEPLDLLERTVIALKRLDYPVNRLRIIVSDDGRRESVRHMAAALGVDYNPGPRKDAKAGNLNSALAYIARTFPQGSLILTQDADEVIAPAFLRKTVGYFVDPKLAFVQTPKDVVAPAGDPFGTRDRIFYDNIQPGRNGAGAAISCGSGVLWNIDAVRSIGGFVTWNLVEDLTTSYWLHSAGYRSEYHNEPLSLGLAPDDIPGLLKQRGTWAVDTLRLFLFDNPLRKPGLSPRQRLQYLELCLSYVSTAFFTPLLMIIPIVSLATDRFIPIEGAALFPWVGISVLYYTTVAQGGLTFLPRTWQYWVGYGPIYLRALWIAARSRHDKPRYVVTRKTRQDGFYGHLLWPQYLYLLVGGAVLIHSALDLSAVNLSNRLTNMVVLAYFLFMVGGICRASLYGLAMWRVLAASSTGFVKIVQRASGRRPQGAIGFARSRDSEASAGR